MTGIERLLAPRSVGRLAFVGAGIRIAAGVIFILVAVEKFTSHGAEAISFRRYGLPLPGTAVYVAGTIEFVCGALLIVGLLTRPAALLLAADMVAAISTAGRVEGGAIHLGLAPTLFVAMLFLVWMGGGGLSVDGLLTRRSSTRPGDSLSA